MPITTGLAAALSAVLSANPAVSVASAQLLPPVQTVQEYVMSYFADEPIMIAIAQCESHFRQFSKRGDVHRGVVNNKDVGVMQINEFYHGKTAKAMDIDLYTIEGNVAYARYLFEKEGTRPWNSSKPCWGKSDAAKAMALAKAPDNN